MSSKIIILDGVGINLKTSIMNLAAKDGFITVKSDSSYYELADKSIFTNLDDYFTKLQCRFMEIMTAKDICENTQSNIRKDAIFVDRGLVNQVIWAALVYHDIVDDYAESKDKYWQLMSKIKEVAKLESDLGATNILLHTLRDDIINDSLDESKYGIDPHATFRIDTFDTPEYYKSVQAHYIDMYMKNRDAIMLDINHLSMTPSQESECIYNKIKLICDL